MDDLVAAFRQLQVRNVEGSDRLERQIERVPASTTIGRAQLIPDVPERAQNSGPIEALPFTMFAKTHRSLHGCRLTCWLSLGPRGGW